MRKERCSSERQGHGDGRESSWEAEGKVENLHGKCWITLLWILTIGLLVFLLMSRSSEYVDTGSWTDRGHSFNRRNIIKSSTKDKAEGKMHQVNPEASLQKQAANPRVGARQTRRDKRASPNRRREGGVDITLGIGNRDHDLIGAVCPARVHLSDP